MKRVLSMIPAILIFCGFIYSIPTQSMATPATNPVGLVAPPEGGTNPALTQILSKPEINPPSGGQGGSPGQQKDVGLNPIRIGLLVQTNSFVEAKNGAKMAIDEANKKGGFKGRNFELVIKSMEGPWGTGSKQAVDMIFIDEVIAIVGLHDGRNAHLVEQATTKSNVSFISAFAGDPTLSQAFTPWFFNCLPNDNQQAEVLLKEIVRQNYSVLTLVTDDDYDARSALKSFAAKAPTAGIPNFLTIVLEKAERDMSETVEMIISRKTGCLALFTEPASADKIICKLKERNYPLQIYGPLSLLKESSPVYNYPEVMKNLLILSSGEWFLKENSEFAARYKERFKRWPGAEAAYSYDATMVMINAAVAADGKRDNIQKALMATDYRGVTGAIRFDEKGNRVSMIEITKQ